MKSIEIIEYLKLDGVNQKNFDILEIKPPDNIIDGCFTLLTRIDEFDILFNDKTPNNVLAVIPIELREHVGVKNQTFLFSTNPKLDFVKGMHKILTKVFNAEISDTAVINTTGNISEKVRIGDYVVIKGNIDIGENTEISDNVVINGNVKIGRNVKIKSGTIIGQKGFNFIYDENGTPLEFPHIGSVIISDNVELGALNTVVQGTLGVTFIGENVKTDDHVHIAHNVKIGKGTLLTACTEISGSVIIGENTWLGPNCSIIDHIIIGNNVTIGIGTVVIKPVPDNAIIIGNPGRILKFK